MSAAPAHSDRVTHAFWRAPAGQGSIYRLVFTRDATLGIVPIGGQSHERPQFAVRAADDADAEQAIVAFLARESVHHWLTQALCDFVEEVARLLAEHGEAAYELVAAPAADTAAADAGDAAQSSLRPRRHLELIPQRSLRGAGPLVFQVVRTGRGRRHRLIRVPRSKIFRIKLPRTLGSPRAQRRMLRRLDRLERASRRFVTGTSPAAVPKGYDFATVQRASESEVVRLTRRWGVLPFLLPKNMTGYFSVAGEIYHRRALTILRDHILREVNALLRAAGFAEVRVDGLPTVAEIEATLADLAAGRINLKQALNATRF